MKKVLLFIIFLIGALHSYGQFKYKIEYDVTLKELNAKSGADEITSFSIGLKTANEGLTIFNETAINGDGSIQKIYNEIVVFSNPLESFEVEYRAIVLSAGDYCQGTSTTSIPFINSCRTGVPGEDICGNVRSNYFRVFEIKSLLDLNPENLEIKECEQKNIVIGGCDSNLRYALEYVYGGNSGEILAYGDNPKNISVGVNDIPGITIGQNVQIKARFTPSSSTNPNDYSDILIYSITSCSPGLTQNPPLTIKTKCNKSDDGSIVAKFDRPLNALNNERMLLYVENKLPDNTWDLFGQSYIISSLDADNSYLWNNVLSPGTYRLRWITKDNPLNGTIPINNSDEISGEFEITAPDPITYNFTETGIKCNGETNGTITFSNPNGGSNMGFEYSIDNGGSWQVSDTFTGLGPATYSLVVKDSNGCIPEGAAPEVIFVNPGAISITPATIRNPSASGTTDGEISITASGGTGTLTYAWQKNGADFATTQNITGLGQGIYVLTVKDANNCTATFSQTLTAPPPLTVTFSILQVIGCNGDNGSINAQGVGGNNSAYTYRWQDNSTNQSLFNIPAGTYTVTVKDGNGIEVTDSFILTEPDVLGVTTSSTNVLCNDGANGTIDLAITGGTASYAITWSDDNAITTKGRTGLAQGEYFYTIKDVNTCQIGGSVTISQPAVLEITLNSIQHPTVSGGIDGFIDVGISGGTANYIFEWTDVSSTVVGTTEDINNLGDGNYTLVVTDANYNNTSDNAGCTATIAVLLTEPQPLSATVTETIPISCFGDNDGELTANPLGGTAGYNYEWFKEVSGTYEILAVTTQTITDLAIGNYRVIVTDALNSQVQADFGLLGPAQLAVSFTTQNINCFGGSDGEIDISPSGGTQPYSFSWTNTLGTEVGTNEDLSDVPVGNYTIEITDTKGCSIQQTIELIAPTDPLSITLEELKKPTAAGATNGFIHVSITGGTPTYTYEWTDNLNAVISTEEDLNSIGEGVYTLTVKDSNEGSTIDNAGCIIVQGFTLTAPDAIDILISETSSIQCNGDANGELTATVSGGFLNIASDYTYQWFKEESGNLVDINRTTNTASNLPEGAFTLTVTDDNGITKSASFTLGEPEILDIELTVTSTVSCLTGRGGAISSSVSGGTVPYNFLWSNGEVTENVNDLTVGNYTLTITDANACETSKNITVIQPGGMTIESTVNAPLCNGSSDGKISLLVSGGTSPYDYLWNTGATTATIDNIMSGYYSVTIKDNEGCIALQDFTIEDPELLTIDLGEDRVLCQGQSHYLDITIDDANATYLWSSNTGFSSTSPTVDITNGIYTATVTNKEGCMATGTITVSTVDETISAEFLVSTHVFVGETIIVVDVSEPEPNTVTWEFSEGTTVVTENSDYAELKFEEEGVYYVTMTATRGSCQEVLTKEIIVQPRADFGIEQGQQSSFIKEFKLYPNPSNGIFKIDIELEVAATVSIKIITLSNMVTHAKVMSGKNKYTVDYSLNVAAGTYMVLLETPKGSSIRKIIIE